MYIALITTVVAILLGSICGIIQNILNRKKKVTSSQETMTTINVSFLEVFVPVERLIIAGNIALIENRCDADLNAKLDDAFSVYEVN